MRVQAWWNFPLKAEDGTVICWIEDVLVVADYTFNICENGRNVERTSDRLELFFEIDRSKSSSGRGLYPVPLWLAMKMTPEALKDEKLLSSLDSAALEASYED